MFQHRTSHVKQLRSQAIIILVPSRSSLKTKLSESQQHHSFHSGRPVKVETQPAGKFVLTWRLQQVVHQRGTVTSNHTLGPSLCWTASDRRHSTILVTGKRWSSVLKVSTDSRYRRSGSAGSLSSSGRGWAVCAPLSPVDPPPPFSGGGMTGVPRGGWSGAALPTTCTARARRWQVTASLKTSRTSFSVTDCSTSD